MNASDLTEIERAVLGVLDTRGGFMTSDVAKRVQMQAEQSARQYSAHIRSVLLGLEQKGLVKRLDDAQPVCWLKTQ